MCCLIAVHGREVLPLPGGDGKYKYGVRIRKDALESGTPTDGHYRLRRDLGTPGSRCSPPISLQIQLEHAGAGKAGCLGRWSSNTRRTDLRPVANPLMYANLTMASFRGVGDI